MTTQTLSTVTLQSLENYRAAASQAVVAYRLGGHSLVKVVNGALQNGVYPQTAKLAPRATDRLNDVRGNVSELVVKGIDQVAERAETVIEFGSSTAITQVKKVAEFTAGINNGFVANGLQAAARITLPGAKVALVLSTRVAEGATALADAAGARPLRKSVRKASSAVQRKAVPVARKAKAAVSKVVRPRVAKVEKAVRAPVVRAKRTAKKASAAVAA